MADGNDDDTTNEPTTATVDRAELEAMIREILPGLLAGDGDPDPDDDPADPDDTDRPITIRDLEAATEKAVRDAMKVLQANKPKPKPKQSPHAKGDGADSGESGTGGQGDDSGAASESSPAPPSSNLRAQLRKFLVGVD